MSQDRKTPEQKVALEKNVATSKPSQGGHVREQKFHNPNQEEHVSTSGESGVHDAHPEKKKIEPQPKGAYYQDGTATTKTSHEGEASVPQQRS